VNDIKLTKRHNYWIRQTFGIIVAKVQKVLLKRFEIIKFYIFAAEKLMNMKYKLTFLALILATFTLVSCNQQGSSSEKTGSESGKNVEVIDDATFKAKVWNYTESPMEFKYLGDKPCVVDFYADWCAPCKTAGPILEEVAGEYKGKVLFYKVNVDENKELAAAFNIRTIPAFLFVPVKGDPEMSGGIAPTKEGTKKMFTDMVQKIEQVK
jgi:thioredoxin